MRLLTCITMRFNADALQRWPNQTDNCPRQRDHLISSHQQSFRVQLINLEGSFCPWMRGAVCLCDRHEVKLVCRTAMIKVWFLLSCSTSHAIVATMISPYYLRGTLMPPRFPLHGCTCFLLHDKQGHISDGIWSSWLAGLCAQKRT